MGYSSRLRAPARLSIAFLPAVIVLVGGPLAQAARGADEPVPIADVRRMSAETLASEPEVTVRGTVIRANFRQRSCIVQDDTDGVFVDLVGEPAVTWQGWSESGPTAETLAPGAVIEVTGRMVAGGFAPTLIATVVRLRGTAALPEPRPVDAMGFFQGVHSSTLVEVEGILQSAIPYGATWRVTMAAFGRPFTVDVLRSVFDGDPREFVDGEVRVRGPTVALFNTRGEFLMPWITVRRPGGFTIVSRPPQPPFESPSVPLGTLAGFRVDVDRGHMVRIEGTVIHAVPRQSLFLMEGGRGVQVLASATEGVVPGDRVMAAGFIDRSGSTARLAHAVVKRLECGPPPQPVEIEPAAVLAVNATAVAAGRPATPSDYENTLIRFPARILGVQEQAGGRLLTLAAGKTTVNATTEADVLAAVRGLAVGSEVLVTGIVEIDWRVDPVHWPASRPRALNLLIRSAEDVTVLSAPSWWTPRRFTLLVVSIVILLTTTLAWAWALRREVARQRALVEQEMRVRQESDAIASHRELLAEQRQRRELKAKLEASLTAAAIAHEIKQPLSHMLLGSKLAAERLATLGPQGEPLRPVLSDLVQESERVVSTIERMQVLMRSVQSEHVPIDLADVVHNAVLFASTDFERLDITVTVRGAEGPCPIDGDAGQLQIAIGNLLRNAAEAIAANTGDTRRIDVALVRMAADDGLGGVAEVVVGDSGAGIAETDALSSPLTSTKPDGTGIGLFVVRTVVENHGGEFRVGRSPLGGAEFRIRIGRSTAPAQSSDR